MFLKKKKPSSPVRSPRQRPEQSQTRNQVFSYRAARSQRAENFGRVTPDKAAHVAALRRRFAWLKHTPNAVLLCLGIALVLYGLQLDGNAKVIPVEGTNSHVFLRPQTVYQEAAAKSFKASLLNGNKLTVDTSRIVSDLKKQFPELKMIAISLPVLGSQPVVYIQPATPALIMSTKNSGLFVLDTSGKALITGNQVPNLSRLKLPVITDESGIAIEAGQIALPSAEVSFISEVIGQLKAKGIETTSLSLPAGLSELRVKVNGAGYYVRFNLYGHAREEVGSYIALKEQLAAQHKTPSEYIDVRVENRVYYR